MRKIFFIFFLSLAFLLLEAREARAAYCPNGWCEPPEDCSTCPIDCTTGCGGATNTPIPGGGGGGGSNPCVNPATDCGVVSGCDCYQHPVDCGNCDNQSTCGDPRLCPDGLTTYNTYCTCPDGVTDCCNYLGRVCHNTPACGIPPNCNDYGGDAYCTAGAAGRDDWCGPNTVDCAVHKCGSGGNCYVVCDSCDNPQHWICEGTACVLRPLSTSGTACTSNSNCSEPHAKCGCDTGGNRICSLSGTGNNCNSVNDCPFCPKGYIQGRIWYDQDCGGDLDEITSDTDTDYVVNPASTCVPLGHTYTYIPSAASYWNNSLGVSGIALPNNCEAVSHFPYFRTPLIPDGFYNLAAQPNAGSGYKASSSDTATITGEVPVTGKRLGVCQHLPSCTISGPTEIPMGGSGDFTATAQVENGELVKSRVRIDWDTVPIANGPGLNTAITKDCVSPPCSTTYSWTPPSRGTYYFFCRGYNIDPVPANADHIRGCYHDAVNPNVDCGANDWLRVDVIAPAPWWQTKDGDVHGGGTIHSEIPSSSVCTGSCKPYLSLAGDGDGGSPGVISSPNELDPNLREKVSEENWQAQTGYDSLLTADYLQGRLQINPGNPDMAFPGTGDTRNIPSDGAGTHIYYLDNNDPLTPYTLKLNGRPIAGNEKIIIFTTGDVSVQGNISIVKNRGGFFALMSRGNINFVPTVAQAHGFYLADGAITVEKLATPPDISFSGEGSFIGWRGISLQRDIELINPSETFVFRPDLYLSAPKEFLITPFTFQEVAP